LCHLLFLLFLCTHRHNFELYRDAHRLHRTILLLLLLFQYWNFRSAIQTHFLCRLIIIIIFSFFFRLLIVSRMSACVCCCVIWVCVCVSLCGFWQPPPEAFYVLDNVGKCSFFFSWSPSVHTNSSFTPFFSTKKTWRPSFHTHPVRSYTEKWRENIAIK
jgi:hypothetical protein